MRPFDDALAFLLAEEGGLSNHPADAGGLTNHGVTQSTYNEYRVAHGRAVNPVGRISMAEVREIYRDMYWSAAQCDALPYPLALVHFDTAVQRGVRRAAKELQTVLGATADGIIGPITLSAVESRPQRHIIEDYCWRRVRHYRQRCREDPAQRAFIAGWLARVERLRSRAVEVLAAKGE